jgi:hypothetical protein
MGGLEDWAESVGPVDGRKTFMDAMQRTPSHTYGLKVWFFVVVVFVVCLSFLIPHSSFLIPHLSILTPSILQGGPNLERAAG